jgi:hypothetical protein
MREFRNSTEQHRIEKIKNHTCISNRLINDDRLSAAAKIMMIYLLSKPDEWVINQSEIQASLRLSRLDCRNGMGALIKAGYISRKKIYEGYSYVLHEEPISQAMPESQPKQADQIQSASFGHIVNTEELSTNVLSYNSNKKSEICMTIVTKDQSEATRRLSFDEMKRRLIKMADADKLKCYRSKIGKFSLPQYAVGILKRLVTRDQQEAFLNKCEADAPASVYSSPACGVSLYPRRKAVDEEIPF